MARREVKQAPQAWVPPKIEIPSDLSYVTLRNWSYTLEKDYPDQPDVFRAFKPIWEHIHHVRFLHVALERIDSTGCVHRRSFLTGEVEITEPIETEEISGLSRQERANKRDLLAQRIFSCVRNVLSYRTIYEDAPDRAESMTAYFEGAAAEDIARYRHEPEFLLEAALEADRARVEGRPFVAMKLGHNSPIVRKLSRSIATQPRRQ